MEKYLFEVFFCFLLTIISLLFLAYALSTRDKFFTRLESGSIKFVMRGDSLHRIIHNVKGKCLNEKEMIFYDSKREQRSLFNKITGLWWIGPPPFCKVHSFEMTKEKENAGGETVKDWIVGAPKSTEYSLWFTFPRPIILRLVELKDRVTVDVLVVVKLEVVNPYIPIFMFKGKFFENTSSIIRAKVLDCLQELDIGGLITAGKGEGSASGILKSLREDEFNNQLIEQVGLRVIGASMPKWDPSDPTIREAIAAKKVAFEKGEGVKAQAEADAVAKERLTRARSLWIKKTVTALGGNTDAAAIVLRAEALAGKDSKITVLADGNSAKPVLPLGKEEK